MKPIPDAPTHCIRCQTELPLLRRYAGLCALCIHTHAPGRLEDPVASDWVIVASLTRRRADGYRERCFRLQCLCGAQRVIIASHYHTGRTARCNRCRMRREHRGIRGIRVG